MGSQTGVMPAHAVALVLVHSTHALLAVSQAGFAPLQVASPTHSTQLFEDRLQAVVPVLVAQSLPDWQ